MDTTYNDDVIDYGVHEDRTVCPVILSRSEGSPGLDLRTVNQDANDRLPISSLQPRTLSDPSLRLRMTGQTVRSSCAS